MKQLISRGMFVVPLALIVLGAGCQDPKAQIDQLNRELQETQSQLASAQQERDQLQDQLRQYQQQYQGLSGQVGNMQSTIGELQQRLAAAQRAQANSPRTENGWVVAPGVSMISIQSEFLFDPGRAELKPAGRAKIAEVAREIRSRYGNREIYVIGHTDTDPIRKSKWQDNWELSTERALTVTRSLVSNGVNARRILAAGAGEYRPTGSNKARNRRVEIYAVVPAGERGNGAAGVE